jgi:hypothetical protein
MGARKQATKSGLLSLARSTGLRAALGRSEGPLDLRGFVVS